LQNANGFLYVVTLCRIVRKSDDWKNIMPSGKKRKRKKIATHKRKKRLRKDRHKKKKR